MRWCFLLAWAGATTWTFETEFDRPPAGFEFATTKKTPPGRWVVKKDGDNGVLAQLDTDSSESRFAMAIVKGPSYKDLVLSVRAKPISGEVDQAAGLVWRYQDPDNYYVVRSNILERNVRLFRVFNGNRIKFAGKEEIKMKAGEWHELKVEHRGDAIKVFLNGTPLFEAEDRTFRGAGKIGVWTKADSITWFDDLCVEEIK